jgi:hypothetical protein
MARENADGIGSAAGGPIDILAAEEVLKIEIAGIPVIALAFGRARPPRYSARSAAAAAIRPVLSTA